MASRLELQSKLENILESKNVYFQPPATVRMKYPAIVYSLDWIDTIHAEDNPYNSRNQYSVTFMTDDPDSQIIQKLASLPLCRFDRYYAADNLNHYTYNLYF